MKTVKLILYFNLILGIVLIWTYLKSITIHYDYFFIGGLILTLWYNWETLKQIKGQTNRFNKLNYIVGILTSLFGGLLIVSSLGMIKVGLDSDSGELIMIGVFRIPLGLTTIFVTLKTLRIYRRT